VLDIGLVKLGKSMAIVYQHVNIITNKCYIGWTSNSIDIRWKQHVAISTKKTINTKFQNALRKYSLDSWEHKILAENLTIEEAKKKEIELINLYNSYHSGYNSTKGGDGNNGIVMSAESNLKRSNALKGKPKHYNRMHGKTHTDITKEKIRIAHLNTKKPWVKWSAEQIRSRSLTRRSLTEDQFNLIKELKLSGHTLKQISEKLSISYNVVKKWHTIEIW
jgi:group I intron endonuclease